MNKYFFITLLTFALLSSCAPDPRREADAYATQLDADQRAADETQQREQAQELHEKKMQNIDARQAAWQNAINQIIRTGTVFAELSVVMLLLGVGVAGVHILLATSKAYSVWAENKANQIPLNPTTRQFPLLITRLGKDIYALTNPNDNSVLLLNEQNPADRAKIMAMANTQYAGALAHEARLSHRPGDVSKIQATHVIEEIEGE